MKLNNHEYEQALGCFDRLITTSSSKQWYLTNIRDYLNKRGIVISDDELIMYRNQKF